MVDANTYLAVEVYPEERRRAAAWLSALIRAARLGNFTEMRNDIEILSNRGFECENLAYKLDSMYGKSTMARSVKAANDLGIMSRNSNDSMLKAVMKLRKAIETCKMYQCELTEMAVGMVIMRVFTIEELQLMNIKLKGVQTEYGRTDHTFEQKIDALESIANENDLLEDIKSKLGGMKVTRAEFSGVATKPAGGGKKSGPKRKGVRPAGDGTECNKCGGTHPDKKCFAAGRKCNSCGQEGHFAKRCPNKEKTVDAQHTVVKSNGDSAKGGGLGF